MLRETADSSLRSSFDYLTSANASYNYGTNKKILEWFINTPPELLLEEKTANFPRLKKTMASMKDIQDF